MNENQLIKSREFLRQWLPELLILLLAVSLRFWDFESIGINRFADRDFVRAWESIHGDWWPPLGPELSYGSRLPGPFLYLAMGAILVLGGGNPVALSFTAAVSSLASLVLLYFALRMLFGRRVARFAGLILAALPAHYVHARLAWHPTFGMPLAAGGFWVFARMWSNRATPALMLAAGTLISLAGQCHVLYFTLVVAAAAGAFALSKWRGVGFVLGGIALPLLPLAIHFVIGNSPLPAPDPQKNTYYFEVRTVALDSPMEAAIEGGLLDEESWSQKVRDRPILNWSAFGILADHIAPNASEYNHDFRWLTRADVLLNYGRSGALWRILHIPTFVALIGTALLGLFSLCTDQRIAGKGLRAFLLLWGIIPLLPIFGARFAYFALPDQGGGFWPVGARYYLPGFPFGVMLVALGMNAIHRRSRWHKVPPVLIGAAVVCGVAINIAWHASEALTGRVGAVNLLSLSTKNRLSKDLVCRLGLSLSDIRTRVVDRSLLAVEDDFFYPLIYAQNSCGRDPAHAVLKPGTCLALDLPAKQWDNIVFWPLRIEYQVIAEAARLTASDLTPILQDERYTISTYRREPCLQGNVINGYFSDERDPDRPDAAWRRQR